MATVAEASRTFWRREPPVIDQAGRVSVGGMLPHQLAWWDARAFVRLLVAGYGAGKTMINCKRAIACAIVNAPVPSMIVSPTYPQARRTVIPTMLKMLDGKAAATNGALRWRFNSSSHAFSISWHGRDATVWIGSGDNPEALKGSNLGTAHLDEPFIMERGVFKQMVARTRDPNAVIREIDLTGTPEELNWGYELAKREGEFGGLDVEVVHASTSDNVTLPSDYVKALTAAYGEKEVDAYVHGKFVNLAVGRVFYAFTREDAARSIPRPHGARVGVGMDFNVDPMSFCAFWFTKDHAHFFKEWARPNSDTSDACRIVRQELPGCVDVWPDPSGKARSTKAPGGVSDFTLIERAGMRVWAPAAQWPLRDSFNAVNARLRHGAVTVDPIGCPKLISYLEQYAHERMKKQEEMSHLLDAFRYPITHLWPLSRPQVLTTTLTGS